MPLHSIDLGDWHPSRRQQALIDVLTTYPYPTIVKACEVTGIPYKTARRWQGDPLYRAALELALTEAREVTRDSLTQRIYGVSENALAVKINAMRGDDPIVADRAATWFLERILGKAPAAGESAGQDGADASMTEVTIFQAIVLAAIDEAAPDVRASIEASLRRHHPVRQVLQLGDGRGSADEAL